jgi:general secretion pathway protein L
LPILKNVLGLDLGSHSVKAVELQQGFRGLEAVKVQAVPCDEGGQSLPELLERLVEVHRLGTDHVVTALRGNRTSIRHLSFPFGERRRLAQAVTYEVGDQLPFDLDEVVLDWQLTASDRSRSDVVAAVAPRSEVSELIAVLHDAGCDPRTVEAEGLVLANLTAAFDLPGNRLLVDLGHRKTTMCLLAGGRALTARAFGVAGLALTEALAQERGIDLDAAERAKCEAGLLGAPGPKVDGVLDQIASEIVRMAAAAEPLLAGPVAEVTIFGGTAQLDRLDELLTERTGLPTSRLGLPRESDGLGLVAGGSPVLFAPAIALALRGTTRAITQLNFRQDEFAQRLDLSRYRRDFGTTAVLAAVVALLAVVSFATGAILQARDAGRVEARIAKLYSDAFPKKPVPDDPVAAMRDAVRDAGQRAEYLGVYRGNLSALDLLAEISRRVPQNLEVVFEELSIDRQTIRIKATAQSFEAADRLGAELAKFPPFSQARIGAIETDRRTGVKRFPVTISLAAPTEKGP